MMIATAEPQKLRKKRKPQKPQDGAHKYSTEYLKDPIWDDITRLEIERTYKNELPFEIHRSNRALLVPPELVGAEVGEAMTTVWDMDRSQLGIVVGVLKAGYRVSLLCSPTAIAQVASKMSQRVGIPMIAFYDWPARRIIFAGLDEEGSQIEIDRDDE